MSEQLYCALAFNSISFGSRCGSRPCCAVNTNHWKEKYNLVDFDNLTDWFNNPDMVKLRQDLLEGKWNPACSHCKLREEVGQGSYRVERNKQLHQIELSTGRSWRNPESQITDFKNIYFLDITTGNKCNSACLMCNSQSSSFWEKENSEITGKKEHIVDWFKADNIIEMVDKLPNLKVLNFVGGEPTIHEDVAVLLRHLIDQGRSKDIELNLVTNLTGISDEMLTLWSNFATKQLAVSIDGTDKVNEYIRYPFTWKKVFSQLENLKVIARQQGNYYISLSHTLTSLNLLKFPDMIKWWIGQVEECSDVLNYFPHINLVNTPSFFNAVYAPQALKQKTEEGLVELVAYLSDKNLLDKYQPNIENIRKNILFVDVNEQERQFQWQRMQDFVRSRDRYRNRDIFDYLPYMREFWDC